MATFYQISLAGGSVYFTLDTEVDNHVFELSFRWVESANFYRAYISIDGVLRVEGKGLHPDIDLLKSVKLDDDQVLGRLYLVGAEPSLENIGIENRLIYETVQ